MLLSVFNINFKVCRSQPHKEGKTPKFQQVQKLETLWHMISMYGNWFCPVKPGFQHFCLPGSTSVRTGSWWSCPSWRRQVKASARSFWSRRSDNAASSSTSSPIPSLTWSGRRWSGPHCRRWWSTSLRTGGCSLSLSIPRWVEIHLKRSVRKSTPSFRLFICSLWTSSGPSPPPTTLRWAEKICKSCWFLDLKQKSGWSIQKHFLYRVLNLTQKRMSQP